MKVSFRSKDRLRLVGILRTSRSNAATCVILCHGATVDKEEGGAFTQLSKKLTDAGLTNFRFDFRGHGESDGNSVEMTINGQVKDLNAALNFLRSKGYKQFGILAASFSGGAVSLFVSSHQDKIKALVYWNSVLDYKHLLERWLAGNGSKKLSKNGFVTRTNNVRYGKKLIQEVSKLNLRGKLRNLKMPVLFIHGDKDTHVPYGDSVKFARIINAELKTIHGSEHGFHTKKHSTEAANAATKFFLKHLVN